MPRYPYTCDTCGQEHEELVPMSQYKPEIPCPQCGAKMHRTYMGRSPHSSATPYQHPIEMYSVAPNSPQELAAFRRANPDVQLNDQLVPLARNRQEKLHILKSLGYEEKN